MARLIACLGMLAIALAQVHPGIELNIGPIGNYSIVVDGSTWFYSGATAYTTKGKRLSTADGSLKLVSKEQGTGTDASGDYRSVTFTWDEGNYVTTFRKYEDMARGLRGPMLVFEQSFPKGVKGTTTNPTDPMAVRDTVSSAFPSFSERASTDPELGMLSFSEDMMGSRAEHSSVKNKFQPPSGVKGFGPVCLFSKNLNNSVVFSSFSQFMAASAGSTSDGIEYGVQGSITEYPPGYSLSYVLTMGPRGGVNRAMENWGDRLLSRYGKTRENTYQDYALNYLGYSTDNGAYYYYQTEDHAPKRGPPYTPGKTYQQTLIDVKKYADSEAIPYKYILLDSWWYYQGVGGGTSYCHIFSMLHRVRSALSHPRLIPVYPHQRTSNLPPPRSNRPLLTSALPFQPPPSYLGSTFS
jgi:hypothetical protein